MASTISGKTGILASLDKDEKKGDPNGSPLCGSPGLAVKDFDFGLGRDVEHCGPWLETNGLVKASLKNPHWPAHNDNRRALAHTDNAAKAMVVKDDIPCTKPERMGECRPDDSKLNLVRVNKAAFLAPQDATRRFSRAHETLSRSGSAFRRICSTSSISRLVSVQCRLGNSAITAHLKRWWKLNASLSLPQ